MVCKQEVIRFRRRDQHREVGLCSLMRHLVVLQLIIVKPSFRAMFKNPSWCFVHRASRGCQFYGLRVVRPINRCSFAESRSPSEFDKRRTMVIEFRWSLGDQGNCPSINGRSRHQNHLHPSHRGGSYRPTARMTAPRATTPTAGVEVIQLREP